MRATMLLTLAALTACTAWNRDDEWPEAESFDRGRIAPTRASEDDGACAELVPKATYAIDRELAIDFDRKGSGGAIEPGEWLEFRARIRNASDDDRLVVLPSDGSEVGWREPHVWFTAYVQQPGSDCALPVPPRTIGRCGLFDTEWHDEIVELEPDDARELEWLGNPSYSLDLAGMPAGTVTLFLHYAFTAGVAGKGMQDEGAKIDLGPMAGQSAFEVVSNPIVMELEHPLALELVPRRNAKDSPSTLADLFTLTLRNADDDARMVAASDPSRLHFEVEGTEESWPQADFVENPGPAERLDAGKSLALPLDGFRWTHAKREQVRVRAYFRPYAEEGKESVQIASDWVTIDLDD